MARSTEAARLDRAGASSGDARPDNHRLADALLVALIISIFLQKYDEQLQASIPVPTPIFTLISSLWIFVLATKRSPRVKPSKAGVLLVCWGAAINVLVIIRILYPSNDSMPNAGQALLTAAHFGQYSVVAALIATRLSNRTVEIARQAFYRCSAVGALVGGLQFLDLNIGSGSVSRALDLGFRVASNGFGRPQSIFSEPAYFGFYCLFGFAISHGLVTRNPRRTNFVRVGLLFAALSTFSLGPVLIVACLFPVYLLIVGARALKWLPVVIVSTGAALVAPVARPVIDRIQNAFNSTDSSTNFRLALNDASFELIDRHPFIGIGPGQSRYLFPSMVEVPGVDIVALNQGGNSYLALALDHGIPLAAFLVVIIAGLLWSLRREASSRWAAIVLAMLLISWNSVSSVGLPLAWVIIGMAAAAARPGGRATSGRPATSVAHVRNRI